MKHKDKLLKLINSLTEKESKLFLESLSALTDENGFGFVEHEDLCDIVRPHSHSSDCTCGGDDLTEKIVEAL